MLTASPTLLAALRSPSNVPALRVRLFDRDLGSPRLRWRHIEAAKDDEVADGPCAADVADDGALVRARIDSATDTLYVQRIEDPLDPEADWSTWTDVGPVASGAGLGCAAAGTRALIASVASDGETVEVRESSDGGATFRSPSTLAVAADDVTAVACALQADGSAAVAWGADGDVVAVRRAGTGSWTSPAVWSHELASVSGLAMVHLPDYGVVVSGEDADGGRGTWTAMLGDGVVEAPGAWTALRPVVLADAGTQVEYLASGIAQAGGPRLAIVERYGGAGAFDRVQLVHAIAGSGFDEGAWAEPQPFAHESAHGLALAATASDAYLCAANDAWHAAIASGFVDLSEAVLTARLEEGPEGARLRLTLRGDLEQTVAEHLQPGGELTFDVGAVTEAGAEYATGRAYWIASVARVRREGRAYLEVEADGALDALRRSRATRLHTWSGASAFAVLRDLARQAGAALVSAGASAAATSTSRDVAMRPGDSTWSAAQRVLARLPDTLHARGATLRLTDPHAEDAPVAAFGDGPDAYPLRSLRLEESRPTLARARVIGGTAVAEAVDHGAAAVGAPSRVLIDGGVSLHADTLAVAEAVLRRAALEAPRGELVAPPHAALEVGDVIEVNDAATGVAGERVRIRSMRLEYTRNGRGPAAEMRVELGGL